MRRVMHRSMILDIRVRNFFLPRLNREMRKGFLKKRFFKTGG